MNSSSQRLAAVVDNSAFMKDYFCIIAKIHADDPITNEDTIPPNQRIDLNSKFRTGDTRCGTDTDWLPLDARLNSRDAWHHRQFVEDHPELLREQIMLPGNVAIVQDPKDGEVSLFFCCWVGFTYDKHTHSLSRYSTWGLHVNGLTNEFWFPVTNVMELSPIMVAIDTPASQPVMVGFASRLVMDCEDIMRFVDKQPARQSGNLLAVLQRVVKPKGTTGSKEILIYFILMTVN